MPRVLHIITGLNMGGAETILYRLLERTNGHNHNSMVISLGSGGIYEDKILKLGVPVKSLGLKEGLANNPAALIRSRRVLISTIKEFKPDVVQTWMYHADLFGGITAKKVGVKNIVWGLHSTIANFKELKWSTRMIIKRCKKVSSKVPTKIVSVSQSGMEQHIKFGYPKKKCMDIPNGFDLSVFKPDPEAGTRLHQELRLAPNIRIIGTVGRFADQKDYGNMVQAFSLLKEKNSHLVLIGSGLTRDNEMLMGWIKEAGIEDRVSLLGLRSDVQTLMPGFDLFVLSSRNIEAFPTVIGESMACCVPCVATNLGDSDRLMGDTGLCVPTKDAPALAAAIDKMLALSPAEMAKKGKEARQRVEDNFSLENLIQRYESLYEQLASSP